MRNIVIILVLLISSHFAHSKDNPLLVSGETCGASQVFVYLETLEYTVCLMSTKMEKLGRKNGILISLKNVSSKPITIFLPDEKSREIEPMFYIRDYGNPSSPQLYPPGPPPPDSNESWLIFSPVQLAKSESRYFKVYFHVLAPEINRRLKLRNNPEITTMKSFHLHLGTFMGFLREGEAGKDAYRRRRDEYIQLLKEGKIKRQYLAFIDVKIDWEKPITK